MKEEIKHEQFLVVYHESAERLMIKARKLIISRIGMIDTRINGCVTPRYLFEGISALVCFLPKEELSPYKRFLSCALHMLSTENFETKKIAIVVFKWIALSCSYILILG
jgi:hypothetical protein